MKKFIDVVLVGIIILTLSACGGGGDGSSSPNNPASASDPANTTNNSNSSSNTTTPATPTYTITYDGNGNDAGTLPVDSNQYEQDWVVTVAGNSGGLTRSGYTFIGWNTAADGSGSSFPQGRVFIIGAADTTLYAQWSALPTNTITYDGNGNDGGTVPVDTTHYAWNVKAVMPENSGNLTKAGFTFAGWNMRADGTTYTYIPGSQFNMYELDLVMYATWIANPTFTITYDGNGSEAGSVPVDTGHYEAGLASMIRGNTGNLRRSGYVFTGWNTAPDGTGTRYLQYESITIGSTDVTLYAQWTNNPTYTVTYFSNGGTSGSVPIDVTHYQEGDIVRVSTSEDPGGLKRTGYNFSQWNTQPDGSGAYYYNAYNTFTMGASDVSLYARWAPMDTYTITYDPYRATSGSVPVDTGKYFPGQYATILGNTGSLARAGYLFMGWATDPVWGTELYAAGDQVLIKPTLANIPFTFEIILYPVWKTNSTVLYNAGLHTGNMGGIAGANALCAASKPAVCDTRTKVHAFISSQGFHQSALDIYAAAGVDPALPILGPNGSQISANWAGLKDAGIDVSLAAAGVLPANTTWWSGTYNSSPGNFANVWYCGGGTGFAPWNSASNAFPNYGVTGSSSSTTAPTWIDNSKKVVNGTSVTATPSLCGTQHYLVCLCGD